MNCKWCDAELSDSQVYEYLRGRTKGNACSRSCSMMLLHHESFEDVKYINIGSRKRRLFSSTCVVCDEHFESTVKKQNSCSLKCAGKLSSKRMKEMNPMRNPDTRKKVSDTMKTSGHKPVVRCGNGKGMTNHEKILYEKLLKIDESFVGNFTQKTRHIECDIKRPNHYKIDIASERHMLAIEVDGPSHKSLKVKECDKRKEMFLSLIGWKVLRFSNFQIQNELESCVQTVMYTISK